MQDSVAGRTPQIDRIGISYMYFGPGNRKIVLEPPVPRWPTPDDSQSSSERFSEINRDPSNGMPCVAQAAKSTPNIQCKPSGFARRHAGESDEHGAASVQAASPPAAHSTEVGIVHGFGEEDDITVLTLKLTPVAAAHS